MVMRLKGQPLGGGVPDDEGIIYFNCPELSPKRNSSDFRCYTSPDEIEHVAPLQPVPVTRQVTDVFVLPCTCAKNCCCPPVVTCADAGEIEIDTEVAARITIVADADFEGSATEVAVTVAKEGLGIVAGAV